MDDMSFDRLINIQSYSDAELKALAGELAEEEREVSRRRRILHGEIDIVRAEMVRRLRDKHEAGRGLFQDNDIATLTNILSGRSTGEEPTGAVDSSVQASQEIHSKAAQAQHERMHDWTNSVAYDRLVRYIVNQLHEGRHLDAIMGDSYIQSSADEAKRAHLIQMPQVIQALNDSIKQQFADFDSKTRPKGENPQTD